MKMKNKWWRFWSKKEDKTTKEEDCPWCETANREPLSFMPYNYVCYKHGTGLNDRGQCSKAEKTEEKRSIQE